MAPLSMKFAPVRGARRRLPLPPGPLIGFGLAVLAVVLIAFFSYRSLQTRASTAELVTHTIEVGQQLQTLLSAVKDAETGQRGFLLTGNELYLDPYTTARAALPGLVRRVRELTVDNPRQTQRIDTIDRLTTEKLGELAETVELRRAGNVEQALAVVRTDRGRATMNRIRTLVADMDDDERGLLAGRQGDWQDAVNLSSNITWIGSALLLFLIAVAMAMSSREHLAREARAWVRSGQMGIGERVQGEHRLDALGERVLSYLAQYMGARVGALYIAESDGRFRRFAAHGLDGGSVAAELHPGDGLLGQVLKDARPVRVTDVPAGYLPVTSALGRADPTELLLAPALVDGVVQAVVELGFLHRTHEAEQELLLRVSEALAVAVRTAKDRTRLEELLEETQRQAEELQAQQEELRVSNEELEEQGRVLKESQAQLEAQQAEMEQTNAQLEEQTQLLEHQKDNLAAAQVTLTEKAGELERANQYKSEFLANMSHELRTPLNSTLILAKLLADNKAGNLDAEQVKFAQTIADAGNDLLALINDILDLSKIEAGKVEVQIEPVLVSRIVESLNANFQPAAQQKGLSFSTAIEPGTPQRIESDAQRVGQVLNNLLSNALKFTAAGEVSVHVAPDGDGMLSFAVRDSGIGIAEHQQEIIFEAFRQADGSTHRKYGGTGLGLSISRDLARLLGGDIAVRSTPGEGSVFTLTLPVARAEGAAATQPPAAPGAEPPAAAHLPGPQRAMQHEMQREMPPPPKTLQPRVLDDDRDQLAPGKRLILVVEDDMRFAAILRDLIHEAGFQCLLAHTAGDGIRAALDFKPSAILLDMNLPDHSGLGVLDQLKRSPQTRHVPVHVISVADYSQEALQRGAIGYALKPVKREQLVEALRRLEAKFMQSVRRVLVVEDDARQRESIRHLLGTDDVQITDVANAGEALAALQSTTFDCMVMDLNLPDLSGYELLEKMSGQDDVAFPPVIVYTGRSLTRDEEQGLRRFSRSIIVKDARSPERLLDEVTLFLHQVESHLPAESQRMLKAARDRDATLEGRRILVVEDDVRNIFALSSVLEPKGVKIEIARNGREALEALARLGVGPGLVDLVLMDIMMPEMDGFTAMREIRKRGDWRKLPIIALTAKAMKDDQEKCLAAGANDYIAKPLDVEKLLSLVRVWMPK
ncbi:response regulator [Rhizobacter sp. Root16D2]|uniref:response regulator n=1 Tax=Rhizobacter sp. Root16D2 TaxID=1736479 RepID=UPI000701A96C|nr:response regulator [Rhizobacter sp. Root16D2]KRB03082.1 histidine kinase [Rhizobacter sp. Root16D2]